MRNPTSPGIQRDGDLGRAIRQRRKALGMSQEALSSLAGIAQPNLSKIERGEADARLDTYLRLCHLLGIDLIPVIRT